jgi:hypothetical protein
MQLINRAVVVSPDHHYEEANRQPRQHPQSGSCHALQPSKVNDKDKRQNANQQGENKS